MLTFKSLGKKGNLGNQLFQIASTVGISKQSNHEFVFPKWEYANYFTVEFPIVDSDSNIKFQQIIEKAYSFHEWDLGNENYDVNGALQSEKYFDIKFTKEIFQFRPDFVNPLLDKYNYLFDKKSIFISVRRGDFVHHPHYYQLSFKYYFLALIENYPDWKDYNLIFMSDDIKYCKYHFNFLENAFFLENLSAIQQLALGSHGKNFIISNSTFSWWLAWLGEKENGKIIRPIKNFRGAFSELNDDKDYFPERWIPFDYKKYSIGLKYFILRLKGVCFQINEIFKHILRISVLFKNKILKRLFK